MVTVEQLPSPRLPAPHTSARERTSLYPRGAAVTQVPLEKQPNPILTSSMLYTRARYAARDTWTGDPQSLFKASLSHCYCIDSLRKC